MRRAGSYCFVQLGEEKAAESEMLMSLLTSERAEGKGMKLHPVEFRLDI